MFFGSGAVLTVVDWSVPATPVVLGELLLPDEILGLAVSGSRVLVAAGAAGLRIVDVTAAAAPAEVGKVAGYGSTVGIAVAGSLAYVADKSYGLRVVDLAMPGAPAEIGALALPGEQESVTIAGTVALVGSWSRLHVMNVASPAAPAKLGSVVLPDGAMEIAAATNRAYVAAAGAGLVVVDYSVPSAPVVVGRLSTPGEAKAIAVVGSLAFVNWDGTRCFDITDIAHPVEIGRATAVVSGYSLSLDGTLLASEDDATGFTLLDVGQCSLPPEVTVLAGGSAITDGRAAAVSFGVAARGAGGVSRTFAVRNDGGGLLSLGAVSVPAGYTLVEGLAATLQAGEADTFTVRLDAETAGTKTGQVSFATGDASAAHDQMGVFLEVLPMPPVSVPAGVYADNTYYLVVVRDGQLTVHLDDLGGSDPNVVINDLEVDPSGPF